MNKKKKSISDRLVHLNVLLIIVFFLFFVVLYTFIIPQVYKQQKKSLIKEIYEEIKEMDLSDLSDEDIEIMKRYEESDISITIADDKMNLMYATSDHLQDPVKSNIEIHIDDFTKDAQVKMHSASNRKGYARLRTIIDQQDGHFYVSIRNLTNPSEIYNYSVRYFLALCLLYFLLSIGIQRYYLKKEERNAEQIREIQDHFLRSHLTARVNITSDSSAIEAIAEGTNQLGEVLQRERQQILRENMRWERLEKQRKQYIATMSHELKTPLAVIASQTELLGLKEKGMESYVQSIQEEVDKIYDRIRLLLDYSVQENQYDNMIFRDLDMGELVSEQLRKYEGIFSKRRIHLERFLSDGCIVNGDRDYLEQAFCNYVTNAIEHTASGGTIRVSLKRVQNNIKVSVYNEGTTIPEEDIHDIWSGFYSKNDDKQAHAGLGLFIVNTIITLHKGVVGVENQKNGVEFWFTLPG